MSKRLIAAAILIIVGVTGIVHSVAAQESLDTWQHPTYENRNWSVWGGNGCQPDDLGCALFAHAAFFESRDAHGVVGLDEPTGLVTTAEALVYWNRGGSVNDTHSVSIQIMTIDGVPLTDRAVVIPPTSAPVVPGGIHDVVPLNVLQSDWHNPVLVIDGDVQRVGRYDGGNIVIGNIIVSVG